MGCSGCSTGGGTPKGCRGNGQCGTSGCDKLEVYDWLSNMKLPDGQEKFQWVEVRFKNGRKDYYKNVNDLTLIMGTTVAVESSPGHDIGVVSLSGELVRVQMKKRRIDPEGDTFKKVYRIATQRDLDKWQESQAKEQESMYKSREIAIRLGLKMKISDVEYQGDGAKAIFYYTADERVDFRQLIKDLASNFSVRIEMRQIGARQEAGRLGGIGSCGRELCCTTWLTDFRTVNTSAARYQQLSLNPSKLAGQCGKLKCCLNYELDTYLDAVKSFPEPDVKLFTKKGRASYQKMDIFKKKMWYSYDEQPSVWIELNLERVNEILSLNKSRNNPESLEAIAEKDAVLVEVAPQYENVVGQDSITRFDKSKNRSSGNNKPKRRNNRNNNKGGSKNSDNSAQANANKSGNSNRSNKNKRNFRRDKKGPEGK